MKCEAYNCRENQSGYCHCDSCIVINEKGFCKKYYHIKENNNRKFYTNVKDVFWDYYYGGGIKHDDRPDKIFSYGDIVTTNCGFDLGFHSGIENKVYGRPHNYNSDIENTATFGGHNDWYKTGVNVS